MNIMQELKRKWVQLRLVNQLVASHFLILIIALLPVLLLFSLFLKPVLVHRGFDLLEISNRKFFNSITSELHQTANLDKTTLANLSQTFSDRTGLGATGESYLMDQSGTLLTASRFTHSPGQSPIPANLSHYWRGTKLDYRGIEVLAIWRTIEVEKKNLIIATEIDLAEIIAPITQISWLAFAIVLSIGSLIVFIIPSISRALAKNVDVQQSLARMRSRSIVEGQEIERASISELLHDDLGQQLTGLSLAIANAEIPKVRAEPLLAQLSSVAKQIQNLSRQVSAMPLQVFGLYQTVETNLNSVKSLAAKKHLEFNYEIAGSKSEFSQLNYDLSLTVFRIIQELSNNMLKHSNANKANLLLAITSTGLHITLQENGKGISEKALTSHHLGIGIRTLRARVESFGGKLNIEADPDAGLYVDVLIPLKELALN